MLSDDSTASKVNQAFSGAETRNLMDRLFQQIMESSLQRTPQARIIVKNRSINLARLPESLNFHVI
jgi:hypothetical protein